jgi:hypothetical protein
MTVKANMPTLYKQLKKLPWTAIPATSAVSTGHGRRARRTIKAVLVPAWIEFAGRPGRAGPPHGHEERKRAPCDGLAAQPGHQPAALGRPGQHRRR